MLELSDLTNHSHTRYHHTPPPLSVGPLTHQRRLLLGRLGDLDLLMPATTGTRDTEGITEAERRFLLLIHYLY
jgi:hypothetical protein